MRVSSKIVLQEMMGRPDEGGREGMQDIEGRTVSIRQEKKGNDVK